MEPDWIIVKSSHTAGAGAPRRQIGDVEPPTIKKKLFVIQLHLIPPEVLRPIVQEVWPYTEAWPLNADVVVSMTLSSLDTTMQGLATVIYRTGVVAVARSWHVHVGIQDSHPVLIIRV